MHNSWYEKRRSVLVPFLMVIIVAVLYYFAAFNTVFCEPWIIQIKCEPIEVAKVLPNETSEQIQEDTSSNSVKKNETERSLIAQQYSERIIWAFFMMVQVLVIICSLAVALFLTFRTFHGGSNGWVALTAVTVMISIVGVALYVVTESYMSIVHTLLKETEPFPDIIGIVNLVNSLAYTAAFSLVITSCLILWPTHNASTREEVLEELATKAKHTNIVLYTAAALLIASVLWMSSIIRLALISIPQVSAKDLEITEGLTTAVVSAEGGFYTLLLAAVFVPAFFILNARAGSLGNHFILAGEDKKQREEVLRMHGLSFSFTEISKRTLTVLGPLLTGPIAQLFNRVAGG